MANIFDDVNFDDFDNEPTEKKPKTTGNLFDDVDLDSLTGKPSDIEFQRPADKQAVKEQPPSPKRMIVLSFKRQCRIQPKIFPRPLTRVWLSSRLVMHLPWKSYVIPKRKQPRPGDGNVLVLDLPV
jgi:hypothetical protein